MALDLDGLFQQMVGAGRGLAGDVWKQMQTFALPELKKIAVQIVHIGENAGDYTPEGAKALLQMQVQASLGIIVAMTSLTMLDVQVAVNKILDAVRATVNKALPFPLL
jgi:hypothetical protein